MKITTRYAIGARTALAEIIHRQRTTGQRIPFTPISSFGLPFDEYAADCAATQCESGTKQVDGGSYVVDR